MSTPPWQEVAPNDESLVTDEALALALGHIRSSPASEGSLVMVVRRPAVDAREILTEGILDLEVGLVGDTWIERSSRRTADGSPHPDMQLNVINARVSEYLSTDEDHRSLAGDQLHIDLDLSEENLPSGTRLTIGDAVIEVTAEPHTGCAKFSQRFGRDAVRLVNSPVGKELRLRGVNARVVVPGTIRPGDAVRKVVTGDLDPVI